MDLSPLTSLILGLPAFRLLIQELEERNTSQLIVLDAATPYLVAALYRSLQQREHSVSTTKYGKCILLVTSSSTKAEEISEQLRSWCSKDTHILHLADRGPIPPLSVSILNLKSQIIVTSALAIAHKLPTKTELGLACRSISVGMCIEPGELLYLWSTMGYEINSPKMEGGNLSIVEVPGTMCRRGGILDIFPSNSELPLRLEFCGNKIESIRFFDPQTQCSLRQVSSFIIAPAVELTGAATLLDYLPQGTLVVLDDLPEIEGAVMELEDWAGDSCHRLVEQDGLFPDSTTSLPTYFSWRELETRLKKVIPLLILGKEIEDIGGEVEHSLLLFSSAPLLFCNAHTRGEMSLYLKRLHQMIEEGFRLVIVSHHSAKLAEILQGGNIVVIPRPALGQLPQPSSLTLIQGDLPRGWIMGSLALFTDAEIFGFTKQRCLLRKHQVKQYTGVGVTKRRKHYEKLELKVGDYVVHVEHGIARFAGVTRITADDVEREYLVLEYAAGDKLYVPADRLDLISRYIGSGGSHPLLSRLGTQEWLHLKQKVKESARENAQELLALYATREISPGYAFSPDTVWQQELEDSFPYVETDGQVEAVRQIKRDMEKLHPMDRLVCGDVGYGKTEVAVRAAFKAVMDSKQVAILVPTTILAQQHFITFKQRLSAFPVVIETLSRFRPENEQRSVIEGLKMGIVDICIGTHRLLQKDVSFNNLGLIIIDEEQRFGVAHKEQLKQMRKEVDVLTLSATPIPRTLHMSLIGVRDMSIMETPPEERLPVSTFVGRYDEHLIRKAIIRELERNGQVFFVHNRVQNITSVANRLREIVPEAKIAIAHGQMTGDGGTHLEKMMLEFVQGRIDVLVCTTIIESGLDIPNANTLIVNQSDRLGLAQLYQLRGRVGRGTNRAYAYFLYDGGRYTKKLTPTAHKRLETIYEAAELGAGFYIAMRDLEIRGAGNLLGTEQSGHIATVGFDLYNQMLVEAVEELKIESEGVEPASTPVPAPVIDLSLSAYIPEEYVADLETRLEIYRRLSRLASLKEVEAMNAELTDRFGSLPTMMESLLYVVRIRILALQRGVESVLGKNGRIVVHFREGAEFDSGKLSQKFKECERLRENENRVKVFPSMIQIDTKRWASAGTTKNVSVTKKGWQEALEMVLEN